ncbi:MAG: TIGR03564 family F420-dependent LLM class oxidoreductase [Actinomycetota bacterium]
MQIGIFAGDNTIDDLRATARTAHEQGFTSMWLPQVFGPDVLTAIAVIGQEVPDLTFGTAVVPTYPRHPQMLAQQALTVNDVVGGRLILGIGPSHQPVVEGMWGLSFDKPIRHLREYLECLVPLLNDRSVRFGGEAVTARADLATVGPAPKVYMAALGPQLLKVTGRMADGTILWMTGPKTIAEHTIPTITEAAAEAGRPKPAVVAGFPVCVTDGSAEGNEAARGRAATEFAIYGQLPSYRAMLDREGYDGPADLAIIGGASEVTDRINGLRETGLDTFCASEFGDRAHRENTREVLIGLRQQD